MMRISRKKCRTQLLPEATALHGVLLWVQKVKNIHYLAHNHLQRLNNSLILPLKENNNGLSSFAKSVPETCLCGYCAYHKCVGICACRVASKYSTGCGHSQLTGHTFFKQV